eukprot:TRINITY_DN2332_c0_g1_i1.p1 TRINITY_DN2332_c0_g1~~TRINITY_DN2332_c0_g1_i1.p1  ORF type:complete len:339 (-),score=109.90 TRINITY_DN2332_c0_g1_i1:645-1661(-)
MLNHHGDKVSKPSGQEGPGFTLSTTDDSPTTFYETKAKGVTLKRKFQVGVVLLEKDVDSFFWRAVLVEGLGVAVFLFCVCTMLSATSASDFDGGIQQILIAMIFGLVLFVLVYLTATLSGGNLNPAVTAALVIGKRISLVRGLCYVVSQCIGAIFGALFAKIVSGPDAFNAANGGSNSLQENISFGQALCGEIICTAFLCVVVLVGLSNELWELMPKAKVHLLLPLAVGGVVAVSHLVMVPIDGTSINPARSFGPAAVAGQWSNHACFWVGPLLGSLVAVLLWEGVLRPPAAVPTEDDSSSTTSSQLENGRGSSGGGAPHDKPGLLSKLRQHAHAPHS